MSFGRCKVWASSCAVDPSQPEWRRAKTVSAERGLRMRLPVSVLIICYGGCVNGLTILERITLYKSEVKRLLASIIFKG